jgi:hypothetical protein
MLLKKLTFSLVPIALTGLLLGSLTTTSHAVLKAVTISFTNTSPANTYSFAPFRFGFNSGVYDSFNNGQTATAGIISIAEGGSGSAWIPAFQAADPTAVIGALGAPILPGQTFTSTFQFETNTNPFFTFASMVIPSNDAFIGNDNPQGFRLFDAAGNLLINQIDQTAGQIWDSGSEATDPANGAFVVGGTNGNRTAQNGVVSFDRSQFGSYNNLTTGAGYVFNDAIITNTTNVGRITFSAVNAPEPSSLLLMATVMGMMSRRIIKRRQK